MPKTYDHAFELNFSIVTDNPAEDVTGAEIRQFILEKLQLSDEQLRLECNCWDTIEQGEED